LDELLFVKAPHLSSGAEHACFSIRNPLT